MKLSTTLRSAAVGALTLIMVPAASNVLNEALKSAGVGAALLSWLASPANQQWYWFAVIAVAALTLGVGLDWLARRFDSSREDKLIGLSYRMDAMRDTLADAWRGRQAGDEGWLVKMTLAYTEAISLQRTLERMGFKVPWIHWETGESPERFVLGMAGYLVLLAPLVRDGHIRDAIAASKQSIDWDPTGPLILAGGELRPMFGQKVAKPSPPA